MKALSQTVLMLAAIAVPTTVVMAWESGESNGRKRGLAECKTPEVDVAEAEKTEKTEKTEKAEEWDSLMKDLEYTIRECKRCFEREQDGDLRRSDK